MNLAFSNIAWPPEQDAAVAALFQRVGVTAIEVAPTKYWPDPTKATDTQADERRAWWAERGIAILAAQALLFGKPELVLFKDSWTRAKTLDYLRGVVRVCARLGAQALVFGSPKNRKICPRSPAAVQGEAVDFFTKLAECAATNNTAIVLEANPPHYGADYITRAAEAAALVRAVDHPGLRLHLDTGCMSLAEDPIQREIGDNIKILHHFHLSEPDLAPLGTGSVDHPAFAAALKKYGYNRTIAIEMRQVDPFDVANLEAAIAVARHHYFTA